MGTLLIPLGLEGRQDGFDAELVEKENVVEAQKVGRAWQDAPIGLTLAAREKVRTGEYSRAVLHLSDLTMMRLDEFTTFEVGGYLSEGGAYFFSRERTAEVTIRTPAADGALRGTQIIVRVTPAATTLMTVLEGEVELFNPHGRVLLRSGEQGEAKLGQAPTKTAVIDAVNLLQWALYYPGVLYPEELGMGEAEQKGVAGSLEAYRAGDLLGALEKYPKGRRPGTTGGRLYRAAVLLAVGRVDDAGGELGGVAPENPGRLALEQMIAAVKFVDWERPGGEPGTAGEWMAESYYQQSKSRLEPALAAARKAAEIAPSFGYAWVRVAELEFGFGRTQAALRALGQGIELTPRNAQAHALRGFLLSAQNRIGAARESFEQAIVLDGALANGWLGRGLTYLRQNNGEAGRRDLQTAATVEPNRSLLHSYLGKAFSQVGDNRSAHKDFARAVELDPHDPTPWLYSAVQNKQENRYNEAIDDIEKSKELNDNRSVYRSRFLLDQDLAVRSVNLAAIFQNNGMTEVSVREATRAVNSDYASASAHLFLANSYNALRDPGRVQLRYETPWFNELLLANLLSPVGGGPLSQYVSQMEYSKLFTGDGLGISSLSDYYSHGEFRETASQWGTFGNFSYALDAEYLYRDGLRPNNDLNRFEGYATFKLQLGPQDTVLFQLKYQDLRSGDLLQDFDQRAIDTDTARLTTGFREKQEPGLMLLGFHHEWNPGVHTLLLVGRLANEQVLTADDTTQYMVVRDIGRLFPSEFPAAQVDPLMPVKDRELRAEHERLAGRGDVTALGGFPLDSEYRAKFEIYSGELNQIITLGPQTFVLGGRYQSGTFETRQRYDGLDPLWESTGLFLDPPVEQHYGVDFERISVYLYDIWKVAPWLTLTAGVGYDEVTYPENYRQPPISGEETTLERFTPKLGLTLTPTRSTVIRASYTESVSGASFDESIRLEPTQVAGFAQTSRTYISESLVGSVAGAIYKTWGVSVEQRLPTRTYLGAEYTVTRESVDRTVGTLDYLVNTSNYGLSGVVPSKLQQQLRYKEESLVATANQLLGDRWSLGARYRYTKSSLRDDLRDIPRAVYPYAESTRSSILHETNLFLLYNHPSGFFAKAEANWYNQENDGFRDDPRYPRNDPRPGDDFWQFNLLAGWRFHKNQCELSCGFLNITGADYQLEPLNYYLDLPRDRTLFVRAKFTF